MRRGDKMGRGGVMKTMEQNSKIYIGDKENKNKKH